MFRGRIQRIHFVGLGGVGMSGIAEILLAHGFEVSGSDLRENDLTRRLAAQGARVAIGHRRENLGEAEVVVYSSAVPLHNPELMEARARAVPVIRRAEMLAELMRLKEGIAIAGSHGKTTTTSLLATILQTARLDPTVVIGGKLNVLGSGAARGLGDLLVAEADESDGSFLHLSPVIAVITNIDPEHLDHYGDIESLREAFVRFANRVPFYGLVVACLDHPQVQHILPAIEKRTVTYGMTAQADYRAREPRMSGLTSGFELVRRGESLGQFKVNMPGIHNVYNTLAAIAVSDELQLDLAGAGQALTGFAGVQRRFTVLGERGGITVVDDYGHHPAEVQATLEAAQRAYSRRLMVVFQPHRYTRTHHLFQELTRAFNRADVLLVTDVYAAGESRIDGATSERLVHAIRRHGHRDVTHVPDRRDLVAALLQRLRPGDVVITLGAGNITEVGPRLLEALELRTG